MSPARTAGMRVASDGRTAQRGAIGRVAPTIATPAERGVPATRSPLPRPPRITAEEKATILAAPEQQAEAAPEAKRQQKRLQKEQRRQSKTAEEVTS